MTGLRFADEQIIGVLRFMRPTPCASDSTHFWSHFRGARQRDSPVRREISRIGVAARSPPFFERNIQRQFACH
jgi:hypothetical protein